jgi:uncharacterized membrane protein
MPEKRYDQIDIIRGVFFTPMLIFHIFSFYDIIHNFKTNYSSNPYIQYLGYVRNLYIILAGYSVHLAWMNYKSKCEELKEKATIYGFLKYKLTRTKTLIISALLITIVSHLLIPEYGIKFGILHFIALGTLLISPIATFNSPFITLIVGLIWLYITTNNLIPYTNPIINTITGKFIHWSAADYFPLNKNLILVIGGLLAGQLITPIIKPISSNSMFKIIGQNSLDLYTSHFIIFLIVYWILAKKTIR